MKKEHHFKKSWINGIFYFLHTGIHPLHFKMKLKFDDPSHPNHPCSELRLKYQSKYITSKVSILQNVDLLSKMFRLFVV